MLFTHHAHITEKKIPTFHVICDFQKQFSVFIRESLNNDENWKHFEGTFKNLYNESDSFTESFLIVYSDSFCLNFTLPSQEEFFSALK